MIQAAIADFSEQVSYRLNQRERKLVEAVAAAYYVRAADVMRKTNAHHVSRPRQLVFWLLHRIGGRSLPQIGQAFGKHHTTVLYGVECVDAFGDEKLAPWREMARQVLGHVENRWLPEPPVIRKETI